MSNPRQLSRSDIKAIALWASRMLASEDGGKSPFTGRMHLQIHKTDLGEVAVVKPLSESDGLAIPQVIDDGQREVSVSDLIEVLLSHNEKTLLKELHNARKARASEIMVRVKGQIGKTVFWELWGNLQHRGLITQDDDDMYRVGKTWIGELFFGANESKKSGAIIERGKSLGE
jgi:hypothetical protein